MAASLSKKKTKGRWSVKISTKRVGDYELKKGEINKGRTISRKKKLGEERERAERENRLEYMSSPKPHAQRTQEGTRREDWKPPRRYAAGTQRHERLQQGGRGARRGFGRIGGGGGLTQDFDPEKKNNMEHVQELMMRKNPARI